MYGDVFGDVYGECKGDVGRGRLDQASPAMSTDMKESPANKSLTVDTKLNFTLHTNEV